MAFSFNRAVEAASRLKEETGWDGMIVTDWADIDNLYNRDKVAKDKKEAIKMAINAGIDQIWVKWNPGQSDPDKTATCEVSNLREIMELL